VEFTPIQFTFMGQTAIQITALDRTERKQAELALAQSEERYRALAEAAQDMIYIIDAHGRVKYTNQYAAGLFGKQSEELIGMQLAQLFPPATYERQWNNIKKVFETGKLDYREAKSVFPHGEVWLSTWLAPLKDPEDMTDSVLGISRNINHLKELEFSLRDAKNGLEARVAERTAELNASREQMRELAHQIVTIQEEERRRVSRELHDEAGQILIGLKYRLGEALSTLPPKHEEAYQRITTAMDGTDQAMAKIRALAHDLRPPTLDVAGLNLSLQSYCREFSEQTSLPVEYKGAELPGLADEISISLYRILQESLTNIVKHAPNATHAKVALRCSKNTVTLTIADNGKGFHPEPGQKGIGLLGMQERLALLGGCLQILPNARQGTRLKAIIPLRMEKV
jgi:PAS domain S-box-containing protein